MWKRSVAMQLFVCVNRSVWDIAMRYVHAAGMGQSFHLNIPYMLQFLLLLTFIFMCFYLENRLAIERRAIRGQATGGVW